jgi:hypothetical protein
MHGPFQQGHFTSHFDEHSKSYRHLNAGSSYRVVREFRDYDRGLHVVGETWMFLGHSFLPYDDGLSLIVSLDGLQEWLIRMQCRPEEQEEVVNSLNEYISEIRS